MAGKNTAQRVTIWVIAIVMTVGTLGAYFLIIMQTDDTNQQTQSQTNKQTEQLTVDPTAHKVEGQVKELQKTDLKVGDGETVKVGDKIRVHYKGTLAQTGQKFDSSYDRGEPADLTLDENSLIKGWVEGIPGMKVGGQRRLVIPANLAYGEQSTGGIPPNSDLVFEIELIAVNPKQ